MIDATQRPARVVFWKDLTRLGNGYPLEVLGGGAGGPIAKAPLSLWERGRG